MVSFCFKSLPAVGLPRKTSLYPQSECFPSSIFRASIKMSEAKAKTVIATPDKTVKKKPIQDEAKGGAVAKAKPYMPLKAGDLPPCTTNIDHRRIRNSQLTLRANFGIRTSERASG